MIQKKVVLISLLIFSYSISAEVPEEVHFKNLSSGTDKEKMIACQEFGKDKAYKKYLPDIQETLKKTNNERVAISCANALGYIQEKESIVFLKGKIMSESNSDVVYACLLSILNIGVKHGFTPDAKSAVQYSDIHHRKDEFVADLIDRIKKKFKE